MRTLRNLNGFGYLQFGILALVILAGACNSGNSTTSDTLTTPDAVGSDAVSNNNDAISNNADTVSSDSVANPSGMTAFVFQVVNSPAMGTNGLRVGVTSDGHTIDSSKSDSLLSWAGGLQGVDKEQYGDPVISRLSTGLPWRLTARSGNTDPRGSSTLLYYEGSCPQVDTSKVISIGVDSSAGCRTADKLIGGKTSQIFVVDGDGEFLFFNNGGIIHLLRLSDTTHKAIELTKVCLLPKAVTSLSDLEWGQATPVLGGESSPDLLSDTGIARRSNGQWVLYVKAMEKSKLATCPGGSLCELCTRVIKVSTSSDLLTWSTPTTAVTQASVPEAFNDKGGAVWLYWQDFSETCTANDQKVAMRAPIRGAKEQSDFSLGTSAKVVFSNESFETSVQNHYATNGNPVLLPDAQAISDYTACLP